LQESPAHADWVPFFDSAGDDPVIPEGAAVADELAAEHAIAWYAVRPEGVRALTEDWLRKPALPSGRLLMHRSDALDWPASSSSIISTNSAPTSP
jgi:hypothetical protein